MRRTRLPRFFALIVTVALVMPAAAPVLAQEGAKPFIVVMAADPVATYTGGVAGLAPTQAAPGNKLDRRNTNVRKYQTFLRAEHDKSLRQGKVAAKNKLHDYTIALNGYAALMTPTQVAAIKLQKGVVRVLEDVMRQPQTDSSPEFMGLTVESGAYDRGFDGEGVVVGVIDTGIWPELPSFADDGSYPAPPTGALPCQFGNTAHNPNDAAFTCNNKLIGARQMLATYRAVIGVEDHEFDSARDDSGHGTHTASTTAGNAGVEATAFGLPAATISGIAPRAHVIAYKGLGELGGFTSDLAAAIDQAVLDGVDVINYSIGGGAALPSADEIAFLFAGEAGVFVATSAGNAGPGASTVGNPATMPWVTSVGASTQSRFFEGVATLGNGKRYKGASLTPSVATAPLIDAANAGSDICEPGKLDPAKVTGKIVLCIRGVVGRIAKSQAVHDAGGVGMIQYNTNDVDNLFTDPHWVPSVHIDNTPGLEVKAYIASTASPTARIDTRSGDEPRTSTWPNAPTMTIFSSRGPNAVAPDVIKPDVTAPGLQILAGNSPFPDPGTPPGELYQAIAGTSMSSPHVAGIFALLKQAHPEWTAAMAKSALMTTAHQKVKDNDRTSQADPFDTGAGHVRPGGKWGKGSITQPGLTYDAGLFEYAAFTCGMDWGVFVPDDCDFLEGVGVPSAPVDLNLPSIGISEVAGSQTITRTVTSVANGNSVTYKAAVEAPPGYTVKVSPSTFTIRRGQTQTFTVTVTNVTAPIGEWRFGSLTWNADDYTVRSPLAVRGALFDAPEEVGGSGVSGSLDFPVKFGYTGPYSVTAHGLVPATVTQANVKQDADQTFAPADVGTGGANAHTFTLTDAAHFRIAMPPESTEAAADLDIYVYNPANQLTFSSTSGGTDEQIDIVNPANGTWTVYVHGWSTPGGDSDYTMWTWAVPTATGGSLTATASGPAVNATTGTVHVTWTGATAAPPIGDWHLGAVSHVGPSGVMGRTLVNVDNRP